MGLWSWIRRVAVETGEREPVPMNLETGDGARGNEAYFFRLGVRAGFGGQDTARIPVQRRTNPDPHPILKEIHYCEVAGRTLEAANVYALKEKVAALLDTIAPGRALPLCYFRVPAVDYELPVYEEGGQVVAPVIAGPKLKAPDLAGIRGHVCRYLVSAGYVADAEEVMVGVLRPRDLSRVPPAAVFRSWADPAVWIPSVEGLSPEGPVVGVLGQAAQLRRRIERERAGAGPAAAARAPAAPDVVELLRYLRTELFRGGALADPTTLYASEVRPEIWSAAEQRTEDTHRFLVTYLSDDEGTELELAIRRTGFGEVVTALENQGINVLLAADDDALAAAVGAYLSREGFLRFASEVEIRTARAPRPERLGIDSISTHGGGESATDEPKEVQHSW